MATAYKRWQRLVGLKPVGATIYFRGMHYRVMMRSEDGGRYTVAQPVFLKAA
jgi:hypothetical protein